MTALFLNALGIVYVLGAVLIMLIGNHEVRDIAIEEPDRRVGRVALVWFGAALVWPVLLVAAIVLSLSAMLFGVW